MKMTKQYNIFSSINSFSFVRHFLVYIELFPDSCYTNYSHELGLIQGLARLSHVLKLRLDSMERERVLLQQTHELQISQLIKVSEQQQLHNVRQDTYVEYLRMGHRNGTVIG